MIHTLQGYYANAIERWRVGGGKACFKPHYVVSKRGRITQVVAEQHIPLHANAENDTSIGIEHEGFAIDPTSYTEEMYLASAALTRDICARHSIPPDRAHIIGHDEARGTSHGDPGGFWDWEYYMALLGWDGVPSRKPIRVVVDYNSYSFWPTSDQWTELQTRRNTPDPDSSK